MAGKGSLAACLGLVCLALLALLPLLLALGLLPLLALLSLLTLGLALRHLSLLSLLPLLSLLLAHGRLALRLLALGLAALRLRHGERAFLSAALTSAAASSHEGRHASGVRAGGLGDGAWDVEPVAVYAGNVGLDIDRRKLGFVDGGDASSEWGIVTLDLASVGARSVLHRIVDGWVRIDLGVYRYEHAQA